MNRAALGRLPDILARWLPGGRSKAANTSCVTRSAVISGPAASRSTSILGDGLISRSATRAAIRSALPPIWRAVARSTRHGTCRDARARPRCLKTACSRRCPAPIGSIGTGRLVPGSAGPGRCTAWSAEKQAPRQAGQVLALSRRGRQAARLCTALQPAGRRQGISAGDLLPARRDRRARMAV